ncbi:MAG: DEAD/DEAH box helicase [Aerococcaceae bacterium]|nr:DEAD/DEAH box helicase [Aerococcaceae bacterium]
MVKVDLNVFENQLTQSLQHGFIHNVNYPNGVYSPKIIVNKPKQGINVLTEIQDELSTCNAFYFSVAFISQAGIAMLKSQLYDCARRGAQGKLLISPYLGFNEPNAMRELLKLKNVKVRLTKEELNMHAKCYIFDHGVQKVMIMGSSNLTETALKVNCEWNIKLTSAGQGDFINQVYREYENIWDNSVPLTEEVIEQYSQKRLVASPLLQKNVLQETLAPYHASVSPNEMQKEALESLCKIREKGARKALVISATGTGKTYLSAFDVRNFQPRKFLFIVHREQILEKAQRDYRAVLGFTPAESCIYRRGMDIRQKKYIFATIQTISREDNLSTFEADAFDYILIDEVHKAGAESYRRVIDYFTPSFLLGMTATPERTDGFNLYELFDYNIAYEIRLQEALEEEMLCPFVYYGVTDIEYRGNMISEETTFSDLTSEARVEHILEKVSYYGVSGKRVKGLVFCSSKREAHELSGKLNARGKRTRALTGEDSQDVRQQVVQQLENGEIEYILTVDIFNEGIDIPSINQVVMLRNTQSSIVFIQQLGRGLRKHPSKEFVTIIDFIGNYRNNYLIPIALFGDHSMNKDNYRRKMVNRNQLAGITTINFEEIARQQIFASIQNTTLSSMSNLREAYLDVRNKVGDPPKLQEFMQHNSLDPIVFFEKTFNHYGEVVNKFEGTEVWSNKTYANKVLTFLCKELLNGKRVHELLLLQLLIRNKGRLEKELFLKELQQRELSCAKEIIHSVEQVVTLRFFKQADRDKYGRELIDVDERGYSFIPDMQNCLQNTQFVSLVKDVLETGMKRSQMYKVEGTYPELKVGEKYSRKDACRLLLWHSDESSTMYGYKVKYGTCPIFVTYHKGENISETTMYQDAFINEKLFHWYTRSNRTLASREVDDIVYSFSKDIKLHLFVKKEDGEGTDFYYLGQVYYQEGTAQEKRMQKGSTTVPVVTMDLRLEQAVSSKLYQYLTQS